MANQYAPTLTDEQFGALPFAERFVLVAAYFCDVKKVQEEPHGSNRGAVLDQWADELHVPRGGAWCGVFVTICALRAGYRGPKPQNPASTHAWVEWARNTGHCVTTPQRGDIFVLIESPTTGHMGIVLGPNGDGLTKSISGNTNDDGSREGYGIFRKNRKLIQGPSVFLIRLPS